jgi:hypothetical protein
VSTIIAVCVIAMLARALGVRLPRLGWRGLVMLAVAGVVLFYSERQIPELQPHVYGPLLTLAIVALGFWVMVGKPSRRRSRWRYCAGCEIKHRRAACPKCGRQA